MSLAFLVPLFLLGIAGVVVPIIVHLTRRQRRNVVAFPSLMFLEKIPFQEQRRRRIQHWFLLSLRALALTLLAVAFARPFFRAPALAAVTSGAREVVVLLDRSYSMGYGDRWDRAKAAATDVIDSLGPEDLATIIFFDSGAEAGPRSTTDRVININGGKIIADGYLSELQREASGREQVRASVLPDQSMPISSSV